MSLPNERPVLSFCVQGDAGFGNYQVYLLHLSFPSLFLFILSIVFSPLGEPIPLCYKGLCFLPMNGFVILGENLLPTDMRLSHGPWILLSLCFYSAVNTMLSILPLSYSKFQNQETGTCYFILFLKIVLAF